MFSSLNILYHSHGTLDFIHPFISFSFAGIIWKKDY